MLGFWDTTQKIIREEGPKALFNGGLTRVLRVSPQFGEELSPARPPFAAPARTLNRRPFMSLISRYLVPCLFLESGQFVLLRSLIVTGPTEAGLRSWLISEVQTITWSSRRFRYEYFVHRLTPAASDFCRDHLGCVRASEPLVIGSDRQPVGAHLQIVEVDSTCFCAESG